MLTVKAVVRTDTGPDHFQLFDAASVRVHRSRVSGSNGPNQAPYIPPELEVELLDANRARIDNLDVGTGLDHYHVVYVMNEHGRTVETIRPPSTIPAI